MSFIPPPKTAAGGNNREGSNTIMSTWTPFEYKEV